MEKNWTDLAWQEFQLLQQIINRQMGIRWHLRGWLLGLLSALTVVLYTDKINSSSYLIIAIFATCVAWILEMSENFVTTECIKRQTLIENAINTHFKEINPPTGFAVLGISESLKKTSQLGPSIKYIASCHIKPRRLFILFVFILLPLLVKYIGVNCR